MKRVEWHYWNEFLRDIYDAIEELGSPEALWFRGVSSADHKLVPSLLRITHEIEREKALFEKFIQIETATIDGGEKSDWETLFTMQHYGIPTRLLDWTEVFGVAVFFALLSERNNDAHLYVLDPVKLNALSGKVELVGDWDRKTFAYRDVFWDGKPFKPTVPLAMNPTHSNDRLTAQRGRFTVHGVNPSPIEEIAPDCVKKVRLHYDAVPAARSFLYAAGIDEYSIFPDPLGAAPYLRRIVGLG